MKVFLDANILFSASMKASAARMLVETILRYGHVVTNPHAMEEARRNLRKKRPECVSELSKLEKSVKISHAFSVVHGIDLPEKDQPIFAGAVASGCSHLWTSDKLHFGAFYGKTIHGVRIVSSIMLADEIIPMDK